MTNVAVKKVYKFYGLVGKIYMVTVGLDDPSLFTAINENT